mgnify:CR=1 FL=1
MGNLPRILWNDWDKEPVYTPVSNEEARAYIREVVRVIGASNQKDREWDVSAWEWERMTYREMTEEHLGDSATSEDLADFTEDCEAYKELTGSTDKEATDFIWNNGDWRGQ